MTGRLAVSKAPGFMRLGVTRDASWNEEAFLNEVPDCLEPE